MHIQGQRANWFITLMSTVYEIKWPTWNSTCFYRRERNSTHWTAEGVDTRKFLDMIVRRYIFASTLYPVSLSLIWVNTQDDVHLIYSPLHIPDAFLYHDDVSCRCSQCLPVIPALPCTTEESHIIFVWHVSCCIGVLVICMAMHHITVLLKYHSD